MAPFSDWIQGGPNNYLTIPNDGAIAALRKGPYWTNEIPFPLPANNFAKQFSDSSMNHSLVGYLDNYREQIVSMIVTARSTAKNTNSSYGQGLLSVQLAWGASVKRIGPN